MFWKTWFDVRRRFYLSAGFTLLTILGMIFIFHLGLPFLTWIKSDFEPDQWAELQKSFSDYRLFMDEGWFREFQFFTAIGVFLALGGVMTERTTIHLALSFPASRRRWLLVQALTAALLLACLAGAGSLLVLAGGLIGGYSYPPMRALVGTSALVLRCLPWIALAITATALFQDRLKSAFSLFFLAVAMDVIEFFIPIQPWLPSYLLESLQLGPFPWRSLVSIVFISATGLWAAIKIFEARDY